jgi:hypothetical protein
MDRKVSWLVPAYALRSDVDRFVAVHLPAELVFPQRSPQSSRLDLATKIKWYTTCCFWTRQAVVSPRSYNVQLARPLLLISLTAFDSIGRSVSILLPSSLPLFIDSF